MLSKEITSSSPAQKDGYFWVNGTRPSRPETIPGTTMQLGARALLRFEPGSRVESLAWTMARHDEARALHRLAHQEHLSIPALFEKHTPTYFTAPYLLAKQWRRLHLEPAIFHPHLSAKEPKPVEQGKADIHKCPKMGDAHKAGKHSTIVMKAWIALREDLSMRQAVDGGTGHGRVGPEALRIAAGEILGGTFIDWIACILAYRDRAANPSGMYAVLADHGIKPNVKKGRQPIRALKAERRRSSRFHILEAQADEELVQPNP